MFDTLKGRKIASSFCVAMFAAAGCSAATAFTRIHDPVLNHETVIHGVTNGNGGNRGPWVAQFALSKGQSLAMSVTLPDGGSVVPVVFAIRGDGTVFRSFSITAENRAYLCARAPFRGWMTVHVDVPGSSEQRIKLSYHIEGVGVEC
jgi:hypothetical protein